MLLLVAKVRYHKLIMKRNKKRKILEFSVISGFLKGKKITSPDLGITRPPLSRIRKSIFDFLNPYLVDANYLDLFSGTGSYLFEAVSRGASSAVGVELEPELVDAINKQAAELSVSDKLKAISADVFEYVKQAGNSDNKADIIMIAPPQYKQMIDRTLLLLKEYDCSNSGGIILAQHDSSETRKINWLNFKIEQQRKYGNTTFTVLSKPF